MADQKIKKAHLLAILSKPFHSLHPYCHTNMALNSDHISSTHSRKQKQVMA